MRERVRRLRQNMQRDEARTGPSEDGSELQKKEEKLGRLMWVVDQLIYLKRCLQPIRTI